MPLLVYSPRCPCLDLAFLSLSLSFPLHVLLLLILQSLLVP